MFYFIIYIEMVLSFIVSVDWVLGGVLMFMVVYILFFFCNNVFKIFWFIFVRVDLVIFCLWICLIKVLF